MAKRVLSVTVDEHVLVKWKRYTEDHCINASQLIEKMIKDKLEGKK